MANDKYEHLKAFRDANYLKGSPHYETLSKLIKEGDEEKLREFGAERLLDPTEFNDALEGKATGDEKAAEAFKKAAAENLGVDEDEVEL